MKSSNVLNTSINIFGYVLERVPLRSILHIDKNSWELSQIIPTPLEGILQFQINESDKDFYFLLDNECKEWLKHYLYEMTDSRWDFNMINFYRIYNNEETDVFLVVHDINLFSISNKLDLDKALIRQWEKDPNVYLNIEDRIPYTKDFW